MRPSTLSRRRDLERIQAGSEVRVPAGEVVRLAAIYQKRPVSRVAAQLVEYAIGADPSLEHTIAAEIDDALADNHQPVPETDLKVFLTTSRRLLPPALAEQVEQTVRSAHSYADTSIVGWDPGDKLVGNRSLAGSPGKTIFS